MYGIDVSHWQGVINWAQVARSVFNDFAIMKATEGTTYRDSQFRRNWEQAQAHGIPRGAYHFFRPYATWEPEAQADNFYRTVGPLQPGDLIPWIDVEWVYTDPDHINADAVQRLARTVFYCEQRFGTKVGIYTSAGAWNPLPIANPARWQNIPLWAAHYVPPSSRAPALPKTWSRWHIHQYTSSGQVQGIEGNVDLNYAPSLDGVLAKGPAGPTLKQQIGTALEEVETAVAALRRLTERLD